MKKPAAPPESVMTNIVKIINNNTRKKELFKNSYLYQNQYKQTPSHLLKLLPFIFAHFNMLQLEVQPERRNMTGRL